MLVPFTAHIEVWLLIGGALGLGWYAARVIQPKAVAAGLPALTAKQKFFYLAAVASMWLASDWPIHDIAEDYLYFVHMLQHMLLSMVIPALFVLATPRWLIELVIPRDSRVWRLLRKGSKPVFAGVTFNLLTIVLHFVPVVEISARVGPIHFALHLMVFAAGVLMWMPVIGPISEWQLQPLGKCIYLFMMSVVPTVPGGFLVFATRVIYPHYDRAERLWGVDVITDQQAAGLIMKLLGGFFLWAVIVTIFGRWVNAEQKLEEQARLARRKHGVSSLTLKQIEDEFKRAPAPVEQ